MSVLAGEPFDLTIPDLANTLATLLAQSFAGGEYVDRNLGDVGGILTDSGLDCISPVLNGWGGGGT